MLNAPILNTSSDGFQVMKLKIFIVLLIYLVALEILDYLVFLDIKSEVHDITVLHHVFLTLNAHLTGLANGGF